MTLPLRATYQNTAGTSVPDVVVLAGDLVIVGVCNGTVAFTVARSDNAAGGSNNYLEAGSGAFSSTGFGERLFYTIAKASETLTISAIPTPSTSPCVFVEVRSGSDPILANVLLDVVTKVEVSSNTAHSTAQLTTDYSDALLISLWAQWAAAATISENGTGFIERQDYYSNGIYDRVVAAIGTYEDDVTSSVASLNTSILAAFKAAPATLALAQLLAGGGPWFMGDLYTSTLQGGSVYRWTSADTDLTMGANTWTSPHDDGSTCPIIQRGSIRNARGLGISTLDLTLLCGNGVLMSGINVQRFTLNGGFDGATVRVERAVMATWGDTSAGTLILFEGSVAGVDPSSTKIVLHLKDEKEKLQIQMPRNTIQPQCNNWLGDPGCGLSLAALTVVGTISGTPTTTALAGAPAHSTGYYNNGVLVMTSGVCAGSRRAVQAYAGGIVTLAIPLPSLPAVGDTFTIFPGCDRNNSTCVSKFGNGNRFRGCPSVPVPETVR